MERLVPSYSNTEDYEIVKLELWTGLYNTQLRNFRFLSIERNGVQMLLVLPNISLEQHLGVENKTHLLIFNLRLALIGF